MEDVSSMSRVDLNQADQETLTTLPGIGPALAARIIRYREEVHPFEEAVDVMAVPGISEEMYRGLADQVTVSPPSQAVMAPEPTEPEAMTGEAESEPEPEDVVAGPGPSFEAEPERVGAPRDSPMVEAASTPPVERAPATASPPPPSQPAGAGSWRFWLVAIAAAVGGAILALLVIHSINGTLNMASHPQVLQLTEEVSALQRQSTLLNDEIVELRNRLNQMEALSGRLQDAETEIQVLRETLTELKAQITTLEQDMQQVQADIEALDEGLASQGEQIATLEQDTAEIKESVQQIEAAAERFDNFLSGLRDLLLTTVDTVTPEVPTELSPTPTITSTPVSLSTATATRTPTVAITPLLLPTFTPLATVAVETPSASSGSPVAPGNAPASLAR